MSKQLYEEALADVKKITEVAENNAKKAILDVVTPRIRKLIENQLLGEHIGEDEEHDNMLFDDLGAEEPAVTVPPTTVGSVASPDEQGKVTIDLDAVVCDAPGAPVAPPMFGAPATDEYELNLESLNALGSVVAPSRAVRKFNAKMVELVESINSFKSASKILRETKAYQEEITQMISRVDDMYDYVQEQVTDPAKRAELETKLESCFQELNKLQEQNMAKSMKNLIKEEEDAPAADMAPDAEAGDEHEASAGGGELTLKLTGLPADVDLDSIGVDLVAGESEESEEPSGEEAPEGSEDLDLGDLNLGGEGGEESAETMESLNLNDDTIVEIDENMLRREIARMKKLRENASEKPGDANGHGVGSAEMDDFGGGHDDGHPFLDGDVTTGGAEPLGEAEEVDGDMDETMDEMDELGNRRKHDDVGAGVADSHYSMESVNRRIGFEKRLQARAKARASALKKESASASPSRRVQIKKEYATVAKRFNESLARSKKLVESTKRTATKNGSSTQPAGKAANLRNQLAEANLLNTKLVYANKLLQNESLSKAQKAQIIDKLDEATTVREAKLVYESIVKTMSSQKIVRESRERTVVGSSSRPTRPAATQVLSEGFEADRWAQLAGIAKK